MAGAMKDWRGVEVEPGDVVIYATRHGSIMTIVEGKVLSVELKKHPLYGREPAEEAVVEVTNDSWRIFVPRRRPVRVGRRYLTVLSKSGLRVPDSA